MPSRALVAFAKRVSPSPTPRSTGPALSQALRSLSVAFRKNPVMARPPAEFVGFGIGQSPKAVGFALEPHKEPHTKRALRWNGLLPHEITFHCEINDFPGDLGWQEMRRDITQCSAPARASARWPPSSPPRCWSAPAPMTSSPACWLHGATLGSKSRAACPAHHRP